MNLPVDLEAVGGVPGAQDRDEAKNRHLGTLRRMGQGVWAGDPSKCPVGKRGKVQEGFFSVSPAGARTPGRRAALPQRNRM